MSQKHISDTENYETAINRFNLKLQYFTMAALCVITLLNILDIFIIDDTLMFLSLGISVLFTLISTFLFLLFSKDPKHSKYIKFMLLTSFVVMISMIGISLTYHAVLVSAVPIICSSQYKSKAVIFYTFGITVIGTYVSVIAGYFFGLCDANMLALTTGVTSQYFDPATGMTTFGAANPDPWLTLPIYFATPRVIILLIIMILIIHISDVISKNAVKEAVLKKMSETDSMTQLYNKNKYCQMIQDYYPDKKNIGVIFWDVNGLKTANDTMGHDYGDYLISAIAMSIIKYTDEKALAYRIGGDEFVMIIEDTTEDSLNEIVEQWQNDLDTKNKNGKAKLSAAVGYAFGNGSSIEDIVREADSNMYADKQIAKSPKS